MEIKISRNDKQLKIMIVVSLNEKLDAILFSTILLSNDPIINTTPLIGEIGFPKIMAQSDTANIKKEK